MTADTVRCRRRVSLTAKAVTQEFYSKGETMTEQKEREAVKRLRGYHDRLVSEHGILYNTDESFLRWVADVLKDIRAEDMKRVKALFETPEYKTCPECKGAKLVRYTFEVAQCETCKGTGKVTL